MQKACKIRILAGEQSSHHAGLLRKSFEATWKMGKYYGANGEFLGENGRELGENFVRTFTNFDRGTVDFRHMGVQVSRINTKVYGFGDLSILTYQIIFLIKPSALPCPPLALLTLTI